MADQVETTGGPQPTLLELGADQNSTVVFPLPIDVIGPFLEQVRRGATGTDPSRPDNGVPERTRDDAGDEQHEPSSGRHIELVPVPPGFWMIVVGCVVAALAPLFGFLGGSMIGSGSGRSELSPIYLLLFAGIVIGGLGIGLASRSSAVVRSPPYAVDARERHR